MKPCACPWFLVASAGQLGWGSWWTLHSRLEESKQTHITICWVVFDQNHPDIPTQRTFFVKPLFLAKNCSTLSGKASNSSVFVTLLRYNVTRNREQPCIFLNISTCVSVSFENGAAVFSTFLPFVHTGDHFHEKHTSLSLILVVLTRVEFL